MTNTDWTELREKASKATPGPWSVSERTVRGDLCMDAGAGWIFELYAMIDTHPEPDVIEGLRKDAAFIAAANPAAILQLISERDELAGEVDAQHKAYQAAMSALNKAEAELATLSRDGGADD